MTENIPSKSAVLFPGAHIKIPPLPDSGSKKVSNPQLSEEKKALLKVDIDMMLNLTRERIKKLEQLKNEQIELLKSL